MLDGRADVFPSPTQHPSPPFPFPCRPGFVTHLEKLLFSFPIKHLPALEVRVDLLSSAPLKSFTRLPVGPARRSRDPGPARRRGAACSFCMGGCRHVEIPSATFFLHCTRSHSSSSLSVWLSHQSIQISEKENDEVIAWRPSIFLGCGKGRGGEGGRGRHRGEVCTHLSVGALLSLPCWRPDPLRAQDLPKSETARWGGGGRGPGSSGRTFMPPPDLPAV